MAPRWLSPRQASWGLTSSTKQLPLQSVVIIGLVALVVGAILGFALGGPSSSNTNAAPQGAVLDPETKASPVISQDVSVLDQADQSPDGAVKAATGFITGMANVAIGSASDQTRVLNNAVAVNAEPNTRQALTDSFASLQSALQVEPGVNRQAKIVTSPASYQVNAISPTRADVTVWYVSVFVDATSQTVSSYWSTASTKLEWSDHWRFVGFRSELGPSPQVYSKDAKYSTFNDVANVFNNFKAFRYATSL